jgi:hypothetical protein
VDVCDLAVMDSVMSCSFCALLNVRHAGLHFVLRQGLLASRGVCAPCCCCHLAPSARCCGNM